MQNFKADLIIIGGGIAGLWALNTLRALGYYTILLEDNTLGGNQTIASQGIIHGGIKYALGGLLNDASESIMSMPKIWRACLEGLGPIDLTKVEKLSDIQYLWSEGTLFSNITQFFASKTLSSRVSSLKKEHFPEVFKNKSFNGNVYQLDEVVLNITSLIKELSQPHQNYIFKTDSQNGFQIQRAEDGTINKIILTHNERIITLEAQRYLFTAGEANALYQSNLETKPMMQIRPLHMVMVKHKLPYKLYAHCISSSSHPRITITSHRTIDEHTVWYLGGAIAESGMERNQAQQLAYAKQELKQLFPWLDFSQAQFTSFFINRAEGCTSKGARPSEPIIHQSTNCIFAWPTKLALTPKLSEKILAHLKTEVIFPQAELQAQSLPDWPRPSISEPYWETLF